MSVVTEATPNASSDEKPVESAPIERREGRAEYAKSFPAGILSVVVHAVLLGLLAFMTTAGVNRPAPIRIDTKITEDRQVPEFNQVLDVLTDAATDLSTVVVTKVQPSQGGAGSGSGGGGIGGLVAGNAGPKVDQSLIPEAKVVARLGMGDVPGRGSLDLKVQVKGEETALVSDNQAVVDRLSREILRMLSTRKVLVIWMFDESLSMKDDQQDIKNRFDKIYEELNLSGQTRGDALESVVLSYGKNLHTHTKEPTADLSTIREAIDKIPVDESGEEWPCKFVIEVTKQYGKYFTNSRRSVCLVMVTDESGERATAKRKESDGTHVEDAAAAAKKIHMPIYVIGRQAVFGYPFAYFTYKDPETGDTYWPLITRGPESPDVECLQTEGLHTRWDRQSSGFGPYELVRLARDTGGIYFMMPEQNQQIQETFFDPLDMKEYVPEYDIRREYWQHRDASPFRRAVYEVVRVTDGMAVPLRFSVDPLRLRQEAERAYVTARKNRELLASAYKYLTDVEKLRDKEPSQRWRAHFDLLSGQIFAYQVKLFEYEYFLQDFVSKPQTPKHQPDAKFNVEWAVGHASHTTKTWAPAKFIDEPRDKAERLLNHVIELHPGTPWALRARSELGRGFSITIAEDRRSKQYDTRAALVPRL